MPNISSSISSRRGRVPPLENGDWLTRFEFERRFDAMPGLKKAELIDGIVYMSPPVSHTYHSSPHVQLGAVLAVYAAATPALQTIQKGIATPPHADFITRLQQPRA